VRVLMEANQKWMEWVYVSMEDVQPTGGEAARVNKMGRAIRNPEEQQSTENSDLTPFST